MNSTYTREEFNRRRLAAKQAVRRDSLLLAVTSVVVGLVSLGFLRWMDTILSDAPRVAVSLITFALFLGITGWFGARMKRTARKVALVCPQCEELLQGDAERIASATGKCEMCGGVVITD